MTRERVSSDATGVVSTRPSRALDQRRAIAVITLLAAAAIHFGEIGSHGREWRLAGAFFLTVALLQASFAVALAATTSALVRAGAIAVTAATIVVWALSRTVGIPAGPHAGVPEPVALADGIATTFEVAAVVALSLPRTLFERSGPRRKPSLAYRIASTALAAMTAALLTAGALRSGSGCEHDRAAPVTAAGPHEVTPLDLLRHHEAGLPHEDEPPHGTAEGARPAVPPAASC